METTEMPRFYLPPRSCWQWCIHISDHDMKTYGPKADSLHFFFLFWIPFTVICYGLFMWLLLCLLSLFSISNHSLPLFNFFFLLSYCYILFPRREGFKPMHTCSILSLPIILAIVAVKEMAVIWCDAFALCSFRLLLWMVIEFFFTTATQFCLVLLLKKYLIMFVLWFCRPSLNKSRSYRLAVCKTYVWLRPPWLKTWPAWFLMRGCQVFPHPLLLHFYDNQSFWLLSCYTFVDQSKMISFPIVVYFNLMVLNFHFALIMIITSSQLPGKVLSDIWRCKNDQMHEVIK